MIGLVVPPLPLLMLVVVLLLQGVVDCLYILLWQVADDRL